MGVRKKIALVGAGPIGLEMAIALKRASIDFSHFESGSLANTVSNYPENTTFFSSAERIEIAGYAFDIFPNIKPTKEQYLSYLRAVAKTERLEISYQSKVVEVVRSEGLEGFRIGVKNNPISPDFGVTQETAEKPDYTVHAENLVLAIGDIHTPNLLGVSGESLPHVTHQLKDLHSYFGKRVLIVGGSNSAIEAAIRLARIGAQITLSYRREELSSRKIKPWLLPDFNSLVKAGEIMIFNSSEVTNITTENVILRQNSEEICLVVDRVLLLTGYLQKQELFSQIGIKLVEHARANQTVLLRPEINFETMQAAPNIYLIGNAVAGSQVSQTTEFIETGHVHIPRVLKHLGIACLIPIVDSPLRDTEDRES